MAPPGSTPGQPAAGSSSDGFTTVISKKTQKAQAQAEQDAKEEAEYRNACKKENIKIAQFAQATKAAKENGRAAPIALFPAYYCGKRGREVPILTEVGFTVWSPPGRAIAHHHVLVDRYSEQEMDGQVYNVLKTRFKKEGLPDQDAADKTASASQPAPSHNPDLLSGPWHYDLKYEFPTLCDPTYLMRDFLKSEAGRGPGLFVAGFHIEATLRSMRSLFGWFVPPEATTIDLAMVCCARSKTGHRAQTLSYALSSRGLPDYDIKHKNPGNISRALASVFQRLVQEDGIIPSN